ncbi:MAG: PAS domain S-box protein, partial [Actinobacteria bacterium]|nr:PAS domain S-box protein [Actinomycetota bacterium]
MDRRSRRQAYVFWAVVLVSLVDLAAMGVDFYLDREIHLVPFLVANLIVIVFAASLYATRSRALSELQSSEERYRLLMEEASDPIFITDLSAVIVSVNRRAAEL